MATLQNAAAVASTHGDHDVAIFSVVSVMRARCTRNDVLLEIADVNGYRLILSTHPPITRSFHVAAHVVADTVVRFSVAP